MEEREQRGTWEERKGEKERGRGGILWSPYKYSRRVQHYVNHCDRGGSCHVWGCGGSSCGNRDQGSGSCDSGGSGDFGCVVVMVAVNIFLVVISIIVAAVIVFAETIHMVV